MRQFSAIFLSILIASVILLPATSLAQTTPTPASTPAPNPTANATPTPGPATLAMSTNKANAGASVTANGSGFRPSETVDVTFNGQAVGEPTVNGQGTFSLSFAVPDVAPGDYGVAATGRASNTKASTTFTVAQGAATLEFSVKQAAAGDQIQMMVSGFQPGETVSVTFNGPVVATATADTTGAATIPFTIPQLAPGTYTATATGDTSNREVNANLPVVAGTGPAPTAQPTASAQPTAAPGQTAPALVHDDRYFGQTGFRVDTDDIWAFFQQYGGVSAFGYPTSRTITFLGCPVQFFQRQIIQVCPGQGAALINMLDPEIFPYTHVNGSVFPGPDDALKAATPQVGDPQYAEKMNQFIVANVPDTWNGNPVNFNQTFNGLGGLTIWGAPISQPAPDPSNPNFIYQRFQRGIMHFTAPSTTESILLADYLKAIITNQNVPPDLLAESKESRFFNQYCPNNPAWLCRPQDLGGTDFTFGFEKG
jgi:hypothetical protein